MTNGKRSTDDSRLGYSHGEWFLIFDFKDRIVVDLLKAFECVLHMYQIDRICSHLGHKLHMVEVDFEDRRVLQVSVLGYLIFKNFRNDIFSYIATEGNLPINADDNSIYVKGNSIRLRF